MLLSPHLLVGILMEIGMRRGTRKMERKPPSKQKKEEGNKKDYDDEWHLDENPIVLWRCYIVHAYREGCTQFSVLLMQHKQKTSLLSPS